MLTLTNTFLSHSNPISDLLHIYFQTSQKYLTWSTWPIAYMCMQAFLNEWAMHNSFLSFSFLILTLMGTFLSYLNHNVYLVRSGYYIPKKGGKYLVCRIFVSQLVRNTYLTWPTWPIPYLCIQAMADISRVDLYRIFWVDLPCSIADGDICPVDVCHGIELV